MKKTIFLLMVFLGCLFGQTLQEIQDSKTIRIGVRKSLPPFSDQDASGNMSGFEVELAKAIGKKILGDGGNIELVVIEAKDRVPMLVNNQADLMIANLVQTPEREKSVDFSVPYLSSYLSVLSRKGDNIRKLIDLNSKRILYIPGTTTEEFKNEGSLKADWVECMHVSECHKKLKANEADGYMHINILIAFLPFIDTSVELGIKAIGSQLGNTCVGVQKNNKELLEAVNRAIFDLSKDGFFRDQFTTILDPFYRGSIDKNFLLLDDLYKVLDF
ncbi:MAG: transporter substrate-binding domain-containing protein [Campylobacter sp.]|nr:transporter substrate-binding domain-containing protein [Campylobacter sp.]